MTVWSTAAQAVARPTRLASSATSRLLWTTRTPTPTSSPPSSSSLTQDQTDADEMPTTSSSLSIQARVKHFIFCFPLPKQVCITPLQNGTTARIHASESNKSWLVSESGPSDTSEAVADKSTINIKLIAPTNSMESSRTDFSAAKFNTNSRRPKYDHMIPAYFCVESCALKVR